MITDFPIRSGAIIPVAAGPGSASVISLILPSGGGRGVGWPRQNN